MSLCLEMVLSDVQALLLLLLDYGSLLKLLYLVSLLHECQCLYMFVKAKKDARNAIVVINKSSYQKTPEKLYSIVMLQLIAPKEKAPLKPGLFWFFFLLSGVRSPKLFWLKREQVGNSLQSSAFPRRH